MGEKKRTFLSFSQRMLGKNNFLCDFKKYSDNGIICTPLFSLLAGSDRNATSKTVEHTLDIPIKSGERGKISEQTT